MMRLFDRFSRTAKWSVLLSLFLWALSLSTPLQAEEGFVLKATVSKTQFLPEAMVGQWSVRATLIATDNPRLFPPQSNDIWLLEQERGEGGGWVRLSNPTTGASSSVTVTQSDELSATFTHIAETDVQTFAEQPTVTVRGDRLTGQTRIVRTLRPRAFLGLGERPPEATYKALYQLDAIRIGVASARFEEKQPELIIED